VIGIVALAGGEDVVPMAILVAGCAICIGVILSGRNPRWLRSRLDRRAAEKRRR
jgi:hypothetical protein